MSWLRELLLGSIRGRLLLSLSGGLSLLLTSLFVLLDYAIDWQIFGRLDDTLLVRARSVAALLEYHQGSDVLAELQTINPEYASGSRSEYLQIWDRHGHTLLVSASNAAATLPPPPGPVLANAPYFYNLHLADDRHVRGVALRVAFGPHREDALLVLAEDRQQIIKVEHGIHMILVVGVLAATLVAVLLSFLAVRGGLRPLLAFAAHAGAEAPPALPAADLPQELRPFAHALNGAFRRLQGALERERRFSRDVAHELRTPLAEMRMAVELARRDAADPARLDGAMAAIERMSRCIDSLLALSRYESGMDRAQVEPLDLAELLRRACALAATQAAPRAVTLHAALPAEYWVLADPALLERIVDNLLLNAVEYAPPGTRVELALEQAASGSRLRIGNAAPGLGEDDLVRLGERFWRKSPAREASRHGGLGLALSRTLAEVLALRLRFELVEGVLWAILEPLPDIATVEGRDI
ncbi:sensor histidine kinase [Frateuria defendens]|uniref:sensor histidine kinase n=1 Tax=Frateuria defendens TaxID=2219559 RepID=UPI00066FCF40|nr:ATP-binding protein [Frateuria defendens]